MPAEPAILARNTSYLTAALIAQKVISFLYFTFLAGALGPELLGKYYLALSLTNIFGVFLDLGLASVLTREVAREKEIAENYFRLVIGFKVMVSLLIIGGLVLFVNILSYPELTRQLVYLASVAMLFESLVLSAYATMRGLHTLTWESIGTIFGQTAVVILGLLAAQFTGDVRIFIVALVIAMVLHAFYALWQLRFRLKVRVSPIFSWHGWHKLALLAWPFGVAAIINRIYSYLDTVLLSLLVSEHAVGVYSVAYKITFALQFIPSAFAASLLAGFSTYQVNDKSKLSSTFIHAVRYLAAIAVPISLIIMAVSPELIQRVYPAYNDAVLPLQVLIFGLTFLFISFPVGSLMAAAGFQHRYTTNLGITTVVNFLLNMALIPRLGPLGAAIASLICTILLLALCWSVVPKIIFYKPKELLNISGRIALAGALMYFIIVVAKVYLPWLLSAALGFGSYVFFIFLFKGVNWNEITDLYQLVFRRETIKTL